MTPSPMFDARELIAALHGAQIDHLHATAVAAEVGGHSVLVCSRDDLLAMKRAAARQQDLLDLRELGA